jgi:hypothetical protein
MSGFTSKITWQGVVTGAVGLIIISKILSR